MTRPALALLGSAAAVLLMLELTARVYLFGLAGLDPRRIQSLRDFRETEFVRKSENRALGFEQAPDVSGFFKLVPYRTNSVGMRDREYTVEKPRDTFRVLVLGSSFTVPAGVRIEDAFHSLMEERLSAERAPTRFEFLNFAVGAYHPRQALALLRTRALRYDPDLILFGTTPLSMPLLTASVAAPKGGHRSKIQPRSNPFWKSFLRELILARSESVETELPEIRSPRGAEEPTVVQALGEISRARGVPVVVVRLEFDSLRTEAWRTRVAAAAREAGLYFLDTRQSFAGMEARDMWIHELDPHPDAFAHEIFADTLTRFLSSNGLLGPPAEAGTPGSVN